MAPSERAGAADARVLELVCEYEAAWHRGGPPDRQRYLERAPDLGSALAECLDGIDLLFGAPARGHHSARPRPGRALACGERLGGFELVCEIGRGGMGVVYEAVQLALDRRVALKVLPRELALDRNRLRRFTVEVRAAASVAHPHIVPVYAVGADRGVHFYAMQLVDGVSLDVLIDRMRRAPARCGAAGPLDRWIDDSRRNRAEHHRAVARLGGTVARALEHAHQNGVIHRDVKPANLLLGRDGHVWVTDFGLAQFASAAGARAGTAVGTLGYMSPEQASGDRRLDRRTDVYSLAATLYELATGRAAFPAEDSATVPRQIARGAPAAPRSIDRTLPADLEAVLLKGLETDPRNRYATAADFADDLDRFATGHPVLARRAGPWERAARWTQRHAAGATGAVALLVVALLLAAFAQRAYRIERDRADEAERRFRHSMRLGDMTIHISEGEAVPGAPNDGARRQRLVAARENHRELLESGTEDSQARARIETLLAELPSKSGSRFRTYKPTGCSSTTTRPATTSSGFKWASRFRCSTATKETSAPRARVGRALADLEATANDLSGRLAEAYGRYQANTVAAERYRDKILPNLTRAYRALVRRYQVEPDKVQFNDIVVAQQNLAQALQAYLSALDAQWQAVVDLANVSQLDELYP